MYGGLFLRLKMATVTMPEAVGTAQERKKRHTSQAVLFMGPPRL
jgi:hypothetical protein